MTSFRAGLMCLSLMLILSGCGPRATYIPPGVTTIVREEIKNAKIEAPDENGVLRPATADIPKGALIRVPKDNIKTEPIQ